LRTKNNERVEKPKRHHFEHDASNKLAQLPLLEHHLYAVPGELNDSQRDENRQGNLDRAGHPLACHRVHLADDRVQNTGG
jgi:hypothetical protein